MQTEVDSLRLRSALTGTRYRPYTAFAVFCRMPLLIFLAGTPISLPA